MRQLLHLCDRNDQGTLFEDLRVLDLRTDADMIGRRETIDASWKRVVVAVRNPKITKADGTADRRYDGWWNDEDSTLWPLLTFLDRMSRIADEGDLTNPLHEWKDPKFRPAQVDGPLVFLLDWRWKPVYFAGGFSGFLQNLVDLHEVARDLMEEAASR